MQQPGRNVGRRMLVARSKCTRIGVKGGRIAVESKSNRNRTTVESMSNRGVITALAATSKTVEKNSVGHDSKTYPNSDEHLSFNFASAHNSQS